MKNYAYVAVAPITACMMVVGMTAKADAAADPDALWSAYCNADGSVARSSADLPKPNYENPVVKAAADVPTVEHVMGLTLSQAQADHILAGKSPKIDVRLQSWADHAPPQPYQSIISIGAFEHFTKPDDDAAAKIAIYRDFFARCRSWLDPKGGMSLQTIAYGKLRRDDPNVKLMSQIFPDSDLPRLEEIVVACDGLFEIVMVRNDRVDYARTCE